MGENPSVAEPLPRPLAGLRVVDLAGGGLAAIGRILAELGADVTRVEPRGAASHPCAGDDKIEFRIANLGKRSVALDLNHIADRPAFERLLAAADILIETCAPGSAAAVMLDVAGLRERHPALVILSATPFGQTGRAAAWQATDPVLHALSGELSRSGIPGRAPLLPPGDLATECAVVQAALVILLACVHRQHTGHGDHLDLSLLEATSQALDPGYGIAGSASLGVPASELPRGRMEARHQYPIIPCADGFVRICVLSARQWQGMFTWMGRPAAFADASYSQLHVRFGSAELVPAIARFFAGQTRAALEADGQRHGVPTGAVLSLAEAMASPQIVARRTLRRIAMAPGISAQVPDGVMEIDGRRMGVPEPSQAPGWPTPPPPGRDAQLHQRPLAGLLVLDFGVIVVGAEQGRLLADQGAEVIKIETTAFPDGSRQSASGGAMAPTFAAGHFNKQSLGINLRDPRGRALLLRLVEQADIILSNFKPGTLAALGLDQATLRALNPRLIMVDSSAFGPTGPWSGRLGYGPLVRAATGLTEQWRYDNEPDSFSDAMTVYPDHVAARIGVIGALALLLRRDRTKAGGTVSVAQNEVMLSHMTRRIAALTIQSDDGQDSAALLPASRDAPWGMFACAGEDEWCVVTVRHDTDWRQLCSVIGRPDLLADPTLANAAGRDAARPRIDAAVGAWLAARGPMAAMEPLQHAGVPAGAMLRVVDLPSFSVFAERRAYRLVSHPALARPFYRDAAPVRSRHLPDPADAPAPLLGEHSSAIARTRLGLSPAEIARLIEDGILEVPPGQRAQVETVEGAAA